MKRVLQIVSSMEMGGIQAFIMNVYRKINKEKFQFDFLVTTDKKCEYDDEIKSLGGNIYHVSSRRKGIMKNRREIKAFFETHNYQVVHCHLSSPSYMEPLVFAKKFGVKSIIIHSHSSMGPNDLIHKAVRLYYRPKIKKIATHYFSCSNSASIWMYRNYIKDNKIEIIPNGIDVEKFIFNEKSRKRIRNEFNIDNKFVVGHIGRFVYPKNHELLIDIFKSIYDKNKDAMLMLIGEGELKNLIIEKCKKLNIYDRVIFTGNRFDIPDLLSSMDVFIMPSKYEGLPVTLVEAQANGVKCIVSKEITTQVSLTDIIKFLPLNASIDLWVDEVEKSIEIDRRNYNEIVKKSNFNIHNVIKKIIQIYNV